MTDQSSPIAPLAQAANAPSDPYRGTLLAMTLVFGLTVPVIMTCLAAMVPPEPVEDPIHMRAEALGLPTLEVDWGKLVYTKTCAQCHGNQGEGVPGIGKPLANSAWVQAHDDRAIQALITRGRMPNDPENTTGAVMPPRGGAAISDEAIRCVVEYLRVLQEPGVPTTDLARWTRAAQTADGVLVAKSGNGPDCTKHEHYELFLRSCSACHGAEGQGMKNFGLPLTTSGFIRSKSDAELVAFIKSGRPMWDPANVTGLDMPPKGGNPALVEDDMRKIIAFLRSINAPQ